MSPDALLRRTAARQHGLATREQVRRSGLSDKQLTCRRREGFLSQVLPGVFRLDGVPDSLEGRLRATALWMGSDGFFTGPTAAHLLGLDGVGPPDVISVARYGSFRVPPWLSVARLSEEDRPSTRTVAGCRICRVERIVAECAAVLPPRVVGCVLDDALRRRLTTVARMRRFLETWNGRRGVRTLRSLLDGRDQRDERVRSAFETKMLRILRRIRAPRFEPDFEVVVGQDRYFLDFYLPAAALAIECHSFKWHVGGTTPTPGGTAGSARWASRSSTSPGTTSPSTSARSKPRYEPRYPGD